jgi:hypothetical protein
MSLLTMRPPAAPASAPRYLPVRSPAPSGAQATNARSRARAIGSRSRSAVRSIRLYSAWTPTKRVHPRSSASAFACEVTHAGASEIPR